MHSQECDGRLQTNYKNYCVVNLLKGVDQKDKDSASELGDATDVTYLHVVSGRTTPGKPFDFAAKVMLITASCCIFWTFCDVRCFDMFCNKSRVKLTVYKRRLIIFLTSFSPRH